MHDNAKWFKHMEMQHADKIKKELNRLEREGEDLQKSLKCIIY